MFLDEVGELSPRTQAKLLRFLQDRVYQKVGENTDLTADVRIMAATNRPLDERAAAGQFRHDLLARLDVIRIVLPPLTDRSEDLPVLFEHLVVKHARDNRPDVPRINADVIAELAKFDWPLNVRQLENLAQRAVLWCKDEITKDYIAEQIEVERGKLHARTGVSEKSTTTDREGRDAAVSFRPLAVLVTLDQPPFDESVAAIKQAWKPDANAKQWKTIPAEEQTAIRKVVGKLAKGDENVVKNLAKQCGITFQIFKKYTEGDEP